SLSLSCEMSSRIRSESQFPGQFPSGVSHGETLVARAKLSRRRLRNWSTGLVVRGSKQLPNLSPGDTMLSQQHVTIWHCGESAWRTANTDSPPCVELSRREGEHRGATGAVVGGLRGEHGHEDSEETIHDAPERPAVTVAAPAEELVMLAAVRVVPHADEAAIVEHVSEARIAGIAHADEETFAALARDRGDAGLAAQPVIISGGQESRGLGKHRGGDD